MQHSGLVLAVLVSFPLFAFAQHSSTSGSVSGGANSGGSSLVSSSSAVSFSSYAGRSSSGTYSSNSRSSDGPAPHSGAQSLSSNGQQNGLNLRLMPAQASARVTGVRTEKRGIFPYLRHPFWKPFPAPGVDLLYPVCKNGRCNAPFCPPGQSLNGKGACVANNFAFMNCLRAGNAFGTGACVSPQNDCSLLASTLDRLAMTQDDEARRVRLENLGIQYGRCQWLQSLFSPYWADNHPNSLVGFQSSSLAGP